MTLSLEKYLENNIFKLILKNKNKIIKNQHFLIYKPILFTSQRYDGLIEFNFTCHHNNIKGNGVLNYDLNKNINIQYIRYIKDKKYIYIYGFDSDENINLISDEY